MLPTRQLAAGLALVAAFVASPAAAQGTLSITQSTYADFLGWTAAPIWASGGGFASGSAMSGGTGVADGQFGFTMNVRGSEYAFVGGDATWDPATQGTVTGLSYAFDAATLDYGIGFGFGLRQDGHFYLYQPGYAAVSPWQGWVPFAGDASPSTGWARLFTTEESPGVLAGVTETPDWSGAPIAFGVWTAHTSDYLDMRGRVDDYRVTLDHAAPVTSTPEPASLLLVAGGLGTMALRRRRRA